MIIIASREERELLSRLRDIQGEESPPLLQKKIIDLKKAISDLEITHSKKQEARDKEERELRHMIGLEKKRQAFEIEQAKKETTVLVREENLAADKTRFAEEMKFQRTRFEEEVKYLKDMMGDILARLPNVNAEIKLNRR